MAGPGQSYERGEVEFARVLAFSDGVFAIAMTLLVVGIGIPDVRESDLGDALRKLRPEILSFFISFIVIGYYWLAHHRFFARLKSITPGLMAVNLVYLAAIAFVPFPTALVGKYEQSSMSVIIYALTLGTASLLEAVMFAWARRSGCLRMVVPDDAFRFAMVASLLPVLVFALSIPISLASTTLALLSWLLVMPAERLLDRWRPATAGDVFD